MIITFLKNYGCIHCFLVRDAFEPSIPHSGITHHCSLNCLFMLSRVFFSSNMVELLLLLLLFFVLRVFNEPRYRMFCNTHVCISTM